MQLFFDDLQKHKAIMCYELTEKFLKIQEAGDIDAVLAAENMKKEPSTIKDLIHFDGNVYFPLINI